MKRLNLDTTWTLCLKMWKWIAKQVKEDDSADVYWLKPKWLEKHGYKDEELIANCFFCEYAGRNKRGWIDCSKCPARKIDPEFKCEDTIYDYGDNPLAFYAKLVELNKIRLKRKRGGGEAKEGRKRKK